MYPAGSVAGGSLGQFLGWMEGKRGMGRHGPAWLWGERFTRGRVMRANDGQWLAHGALPLMTRGYGNEEGHGSAMREMLLEVWDAMVWERHWVCIFLVCCFLDLAWHGDTPNLLVAEHYNTHASSDISLPLVLPHLALIVVQEIPSN